MTNMMLFDDDDCIYDYDDYDHHERYHVISYFDDVDLMLYQ